MAAEIERKFLTTSELWRTENPEYLCQGYLNRDKARTVRVRKSASNAWLTIKGPTVGITREEFEYPISIDDASSLLALCEGAVIEKYRHRVPFAENIWEVDEFLGENAGLVVAEVELQSEVQSIELPPWVGQEVSGQRQYYNAMLTSKPYSTWV